VIDASITRLVQEAPVLDETVIAELVGELRDLGSPLAIAIARVVELVGARKIDPGIALPALAMACSTLTDPLLTDREREAARFEIETLLPLPAEPDVAVSQLTRGRRPQT
jgi:hypothetical protein